MSSNTLSRPHRDANLDLLRIVSMLLIIYLHSIDHSGVLEAAAVSGTAMYFYVRFAYALCQVCVNCYVLLSGYYLVTSHFRLQKLIALWLETVFYALTIRLIFIAAGQRDFSLFSLLSCFFPILTGRYWYITIYVGLYLIFPFLNILVRAMNKKQHLLLNICLFVLFSLWNSIHPSIAGMNSGGGWGLAWFVVLYLLAAWFRLYYTPHTKSYPWFLAAFLFPLLMAIAHLIADKLGIGVLQSVIHTWFHYNSAPVYLMTFSLFVGFLNLLIKNQSAAAVISHIAPLTSGVYLIHKHSDFSPWLWETLALPEKMQTSLFPLLQIAIVLSIFIFCIGIDALRQATVGRLEKAPAVSRFSNRVNNFVSGLLDRLGGI